MVNAAMIEETEQPKVYLVPENNVEFLKKNIDKLNRRCAKLGNSIIELKEVGESFRYWVVKIGTKNFVEVVMNTIPTDPSDVLREFNRKNPHYNLSDWEVSIRRYVHFNVLGTAPSLNGWKLIAVLEHLQAGNIIRRIPGSGNENLPIEVRYSKPVCEHCNAARIRKDTYIVEHEDGRIVQVGKSCMKDFTGHTDPKTIASIAEYLHSYIASGVSEDEESFGSSSGQRYYFVKHILATAARVIRVDGVYRAAKFDNSTKSTVFDGMSSSPEQSKHFRKKYGEENLPEDILKAEKCIEWATKLTTQNDFAWNLKLVLSETQCVSRQIGLIVAGLGSFINRPDNTDEKREESTKESKPVKVSEYFGEIKMRYTRTLTVKKIFAIENEFGSANIIIFNDEDGNSFKWTTGSYFTHKATGTNIGEGMTIEATFTIKDHKEYKDIKQTVIFRVVADEIVEKVV